MSDFDMSGVDEFVHKSNSIPKEKQESNAAAIRKNITMTQEVMDIAAEIQITDFSSLIRASLRHFATLDKADRDALINAEYIPTRK